MIFKNYEYFLMIAEEGSVSKAAERLYISQPSLSKYLKRLEKNVGVKLFYRDSYPLRLTDAGKLYLSYVKDIVQKEKRLTEDLAIIQNTETGVISIGITVWRSSIVLPIVLPKFKKQYPGIEVKVYEGSHQYMDSLMKLDKVDFSIFHRPNSYQDITFEHILYEKILFCVNSNHPLLQGLGKKQSHNYVGSISNDDFMRFRSEPFILLMPGQNIRDITQNFLNKLGIEPNIVLETSNIVTAMNAVKTGLGVTFVPETVLHIPEQAQGLSFFTVDIPPLQWEVGFAYKTGEAPGRQARLLMNCIRDSAHEHTFGQIP
jgi:LysR family transcriptional activator of glutamate synthase operon